MKPTVRIVYCPRCRWLLRAAWYAQELLSTFEDELGEVALAPGPSGSFEVCVGDQTIWSREEQGRFPEAKELKRALRDVIAPGRDLGHADRGGG